MSAFLEIAQPFIEQGIPVFPLSPRSKVPPPGFRWLQEASTDEHKLAEWNAACPEYNVALVANGEFCFLEFDVKGGLTAMANEMGQEVPNTRRQKSGSGGSHAIFRHSERSRRLGNRSVNLPTPCTCEKQQNGGCTLASCAERSPHHHHEWFSFRADNKYLVGAGSVHPNGRHYETRADVEPSTIPDWVCDFIEKHSQPTKPIAKPKEAIPVSDDFDFEDFLDFYGLTVAYTKDDDWYVVEECPGVGYRHENSTETAFFHDGETLGWNCFAQGCPTCGMPIGKLIRFLNDRKGEAYRGIIWEQDDDDLAGVEWDDNDEAESLAVAVPSEEFPAYETQKAKHFKDDYTEGIEDVVEQLREVGELPLSPNDLLPEPASINITDPMNATGMEFPGSTCMYGKLAEISSSLPRLQQGLLYPSILATAATSVRPSGKVRPNLYVALLGPVAVGKTACMDAAVCSIHIDDREDVVVEDAPGSHSGLMNQLSDSEPVLRLLYIDELRAMLNACAIQGSVLPQMLCTLWNRDKTGGSVKKSRQVVYGRVSILGGLAVSDSAEFAKVFGANSVTGLYDRFLFGYATERVKFRDPNVHPINLKNTAVHIPEWVWEAKDRWSDEAPERGRMSEQVLRVALVTASCNGDGEITAPCLEAAFRFIEWQLRLRQIFKPGLAETKEAECYEAVYAALRERYEKQKADRIAPKGARLLSIDLEQEHRWQLLNFASIVNSKSYYRKYAGLIDRVRKSMLESGIIEAVHEEEQDERGKSKGRTKTKFVCLVGTLK